MKIEIRKAKKGDGKNIASSFNEGLRRGFNKYTGRNLPFNKKKIERMEKSFKEHKKNFCCFVALDKEKLVGSCMFTGKSIGRTRHRVEAGWGVHPDYAGKGIASKMVKVLIKEAKKRGFKRIEAEIAVKNNASVRLAKKLGFRIEGRKKDGLLLDNRRYLDTYIFGKVLR